MATPAEQGVQVPVVPEVTKHVVDRQQRQQPPAVQQVAIPGGVGALTHVHGREAHLPVFALRRGAVTGHARRLGVGQHLGVLGRRHGRVVCRGGRDPCEEGLPLSIISRLAAAAVLALDEGLGLLVHQLGQVVLLVNVRMRHAFALIADGEVVVDRVAHQAVPARPPGRHVSGPAAALEPVHVQVLSEKARAVACALQVHRCGALLGCRLPQRARAVTVDRVVGHGDVVYVAA